MCWCIGMERIVSDNTLYRIVGIDHCDSGSECLSLTYYRVTAVIHHAIVGMSASISPDLPLIHSLKRLMMMVMNWSSQKMRCLQRNPVPQQQQQQQQAQ